MRSDASGIRRQHPRRNWLPLGAALVASAFFVFWSAREWMFTRFDSVGYVPYLVRAAPDDDALVNRYLPDPGWWDRNGQARLVDHGFLPALLWRTVLPAGNLRAAHCAVSITAIVSLLLCAELLRRHVLAASAPAWSTTALATLTVGFLAYILQRYHGRPEVFAIVVALAGLHGFLATKPGSRGHALLAGAALGALLVTHPAAAVLSTTLWIAHLAGTRTITHFARDAAWSVLAGGAVLAVCFWWYPYAPADWLRGVARAARIVADWETRPVLFLHWAVFPFWGLRGVVLFVVGLTAALWWWTRRRGLAQPWLCAAAGVVLVAEIWLLALRQGFTVYNVDWLTAVALPLVPLALVRLRPSRWRLVAAATTAVVLLAAPWALVREHLMRLSAHHAGLTAARVRAELAQLRAEFPGAVGAVAGSFFHLAPADGTVLAFESRLPQAIARDDVRFALAAQNDSYAPRAPEVAGWELRADHFHAAPLRAYGREFTLREKPQTYGYAVYVRTPRPSSGE